jgi:hypothetical protein
MNAFSDAKLKPRQRYEVINQIFSEAVADNNRNKVETLLTMCACVDRQLYGVLAKQFGRALGSVYPQLYGARGREIVVACLRIFHLTSEAMNDAPDWLTAAPVPPEFPFAPVLLSWEDLINVTPDLVAYLSAPSEASFARWLPSRPPRKFLKQIPTESPECEGAIYFLAALIPSQEVATLPESEEMKGWATSITRTVEGMSGGQAIVNALPPCDLALALHTAEATALQMLPVYLLTAATNELGREDHIQIFCEPFGNAEQNLAHYIRFNIVDDLTGSWILRRIYTLSFPSSHYDWEHTLNQVKTSQAVPMHFAFRVLDERLLTADHSQSRFFYFVVGPEAEANDAAPAWNSGSEASQTSWWESEKEVGTILEGLLKNTVASFIHTPSEAISAEHDFCTLDGRWRGCVKLDLSRTANEASEIIWPVSSQNMKALAATACLMLHRQWIRYVGPQCG